MKSPFPVLLALSGVTSVVFGQNYCGVDITAAKTDPSINWHAVNFTRAAFDYMAVLAQAGTTGPDPNPANATAIDIHSHVVFPWYRVIQPTTGGEPTPDWSTQLHLEHAFKFGIDRSILGNSAPMANVYFGNRQATKTLARLINLSLSVLAHCRPERFSFFAVVPLPYSQDAIAEAQYAIDTLGAVGISVLSNHEELYLGDAKFDPFWTYLQGRPENNTIVFVHPTHPYLKIGNKWIEANPTVYSTGLTEFYYQTARAIMSLTYQTTLKRFPKLIWCSTHVGGAFPSILDRMIKTLGPVLEAEFKDIYRSRFYWDSAGPTYPNQVQGLLAYGIPKTRLTFGTDYPYAPPITYQGSYMGLVNAPFLTPAELQGILRDNAVALFGNKIQW